MEATRVLPGVLSTYIFSSTVRCGHSCSQAKMGPSRASSTAFYSAGLHRSRSCSMVLLVAYLVEENLYKPSVMFASLSGKTSAGDENSWRGRVLATATAARRVERCCDVFHLESAPTIVGGQYKKHFRAHASTQQPVYHHTFYDVVCLVLQRLVQHGKVQPGCTVVSSRCPRRAERERTLNQNTTANQLALNIRQGFCTQLAKKSCAWRQGGWARASREDFHGQKKCASAPAAENSVW